MSIAPIDVAVLAGGLGTRLKGVLSDIPKIMAPVAGKPFLEHLLEWLARQGVRRVILGLGHRAEAVVAFLESRPFPLLEVETLIEPEPLGTAGAVGFALPRFHSEPVLVMNGDTVVEADLNAFLRAHRDSGAEASILCAEVENAGRYGRIEIGADGRVVRFVEKDPAADGAAWINAGMYLFSPAFLARFASIGKGSLERDVLETAPAHAIFAFQTRGRFLDIGTPETLALAPEVLTRP